MANNRMLRAALAYAERLNWAVIPLHTIQSDGTCGCGKANCTSPGKHPITTHGVSEATKDIEKIKEWWSKYPNANIGIAAGRRSGFWVLDIDGEMGEIELKQLEAANGRIPDTVEQLTGGGGRHILFKYPEDVKIPNRVGLRPKVDIRSDGGYIVVSPSIHKSGRNYAWEVSSHPLEIAIAEAPHWLLKLVTENESMFEIKPLTYWQSIASGVYEGQRNSTVASIIGHLLSHRIEPVLAAQLVFAWNRQYNKPPLPDDEVMKVIDSIAGRELRKIKYFN